jgi:hypothetical protein
MADSPIIAAPGPTRPPVHAAGVVDDLHHAQDLGFHLVGQRST